MAQSPETASAIKEIIKLMESPTSEDAALIERAYKLAENVHRDHIRLSGDPFLTHPVEVAKLLAEMKMCPASVAAGLLHDALEETKITPEEIERDFGKEVRFLVEGVTKLGHIKYHGMKRYVESMRRFFVAVSQDIRVLLIKFCDRLHNMRTLEFQQKEKQREISLETLEIYVPLAYRLGIRRISRELENLAFPFVYPDEYEKLKEMLRKKKRETQRHLEKFHKMLKKHLAKEEMLNFRTDYRLKTLWSLYGKLERKDGDIEKIYDISALRVIVAEVGDCYKVLGTVHGIWRPLPGRIKDYIAFPKPNGYQSLHTTIFIGDGSIIEVQIRTEEMHKQAEYGIASHIIYEGKEIGAESGRGNYFYFNWLANLLPKRGTEKENNKEKLPPIKETAKWLKDLAEYQTEAEKQQEYVKNLKADFFNERIFVFTPKGDVIDLPLDSSPIDFAYAVHSDIGDHISAVRVNGKMVSLDTRLKNGDIVEIMTRTTSHPSIKWLDMARTTVAHKHIASSLSHKETIKKR